MGIRGMQTFLEQECPDACRYVSIKQLADDHRERFNRSPTLVVDGMSLLTPLYINNSLEWVYGGQWVQFVKELESFIERFKRIDVKLVFIFDGTVSAKKRDEWVRRRVSKYQQIKTIFLQIRTSACEPDRKLAQIPTSTGTLARFAAQELGAEVLQTDREADDVIAEYALNHQDVFGILSQDSDFVIYNTKSYLSLLHLDLNTMWTIHYDRNCFAERYLNLRVGQLPLFACLMGNDFVPSDKLRPFHQRISSTGRVHFSTIAPNISKMIRTNNWHGDIMNTQELNSISEAVFGYPYMANIIHGGLKSYVVNGNAEHCPVSIRIPRNMEREIYVRHYKCLNAPYIYNLLCNLEYESSEVLEDSPRLPSALVYRAIRQRCYGVLLNCFYRCNPNTKPVPTENGIRVTIKEWCAYHGNDMHQAELVKPLPLQVIPFTENGGNIPKIEDVWFKFSSKDKLLLFWSILQVPMEFETLAALPEHLKVLSCVLCYLVAGVDSGSFLRPLDVAIFVAQALILQRKSVQDLKQLVPPFVDSAAVNLCTLFMRGVTTLLMVLSTCDFPFEVKFAMPWKFFDGKLFHTLYHAAKQRPSVRKLCENQNDTIIEFYNLLHAVTNNTEYAVNRLNWKTVFEDFDY